MSKETITVLADGLTAFGFVRSRGEVIEVDQRMREGTVDRDGSSWLDFDEDAQRRFFGRIMFARGNISVNLRKADERAQEAAAATKAAAAEHNGLAALRDAWREEDSARRSKKLVTRSRTTAGRAT